MRTPPVYTVVAVLSAPLVRGPYRLRVRGKENLPSSGGFVLTCNHVSSFDPWPLGMPLWPQRLLRFGPLRVAYGPPVDIDDLRGSDDLRAAAQEATDRLMARIAELEASLV